MNDQTSFSQDWLNDSEFEQWITVAPNNTQARCKLCKQTFNLSNMGRQALVSHAAVKKHQTHAHRVISFFKPSSTREISASEKTSATSGNEA